MTSPSQSGELAEKCEQRHDLNGVPERIRKFISIDRSSGCWLWTGHLNKGNGYGQVWNNGKRHRPHRLIYEMLEGEITNETLDHLCRVRHCVNPSHLEPVSNKENSLRGFGAPAKNARKTTCPKGHPYDIFENNKCEGVHRRCSICYKEKLRIRDKRAWPIRAAKMRLAKEAARGKK